MKNLREASSVFLNFEGEYIQQWEQESIRWIQMGVYEKVTEIVQPKNNQIIVDIGAGTAVLVAHLFMENEHSRYVCMEASRVMAAEVGMRVAEKRLPFHVYMNGSLDSTKEGKLFWKYDPLPQKLLERVRADLGRMIAYINDDVRYPTVAPPVLGNEKIDTATFTFPGKSDLAWYLWPYNYATRLSENNRRKRTIESSAALRTAAYDFATRHTKDGGKMIIAERIKQKKDVDPAQGSLGLLSQSMGNYGNYWRAGKVVTSGSISRDQNAALDWLGDDNVLASKQFEHGVNYRVAIIELMRNMKDCSEPPLPSPLNK